MNVKKWGIAGVLLAVSAFLVWLVWIETKVLVVTLLLLAASVAALTFVLKKL